MSIRCIQIGTSTVQGDLVSRDGDKATVKVGETHLTGRLIEEWRKV